LVKVGPSEGNRESCRGSTDTQVPFFRSDGFTPTVFAITYQSTGSRRQRLASVVSDQGNDASGRARPRRSEAVLSNGRVPFQRKAQSWLISLLVHENDLFGHPHLAPANHGSLAGRDDPNDDAIAGQGQSLGAWLPVLLLGAPENQRLCDDRSRCGADMTGPTVVPRFAWA